MTSPPKRNPTAPTKEQWDSRDNQTHTDFTGAGASPQVADGGNPFARFKAVWSARVTPAGRKLVLLALADFADADGTNIRPSVATVAERCNLSPNSVRVHISDLLKMRVLQLTRKSSQWSTNTYSLNFDALSDLQPTGTLNGGQNGADLQPTGTLNTRRPPAHKFQGSSPRASDYQPTGDDPGYTRVNNPPGGGGGSGPGFAGPKGADAALWDRWVRNRSEADRLDLVERGNELSASGHNLDRLVKQAIDNNWRNWPRVDGVTKVIASKLGSAKTREDYLKRRAT